MADQINFNKFCYVMLLTVISWQLSFCLVSCDDISIFNKNTNQIVFQTASDFIRSSECGSFFQKEAHFVVSNPVLICETGEGLVPIPLNSFPTRLYDVVKATVVESIYFLTGIDFKYALEDTPWVLITQAEENGFCDLETKLRNIAKAGYSSVLLATNKITKKTLEFNLKLATKRKGFNFLDIHLINPWDIHVLSKYTDSILGKSNGTFTILGPPRAESQKCKDFYKETILSKFVRKLKEKILPNYVRDFDRTNISFSVVATLMLLSPVLYLYMYQIGEFSNIFDDDHYSYRQSHQRPAGSSKRRYRYQKYSRETPPPPTPQAELRGTVSMKLKLLGLQITRIEEMTTSRVKAAYKIKAKKEHPDRYNHLNKEEYQKQTEKFTNIKGAYEYLLTICIDATPTEE